MNFLDLKCINDDVNLTDYLKLYDNVRSKMPNPLWLKPFELNEIKEILANGGKIWLYYDNDNIVCSVFYISVKEENLKKHRVYQDKNITGSLGPIMVNPLYVGNGYQLEMLKVLESYASSIGKKIHIYKSP